MNEQSAHQPLLRVEDAARYYGAVRSVDGVSLDVRSGERRAIIGPNGAGKTTLLDLIAGIRNVSSGRIYFNGQDVTRMPVHRRVRRGVVKTFQRSSLFDGLSVAENVFIAAQRAHRGGMALMRRSQADSEVRQRVHTVLNEVGLSGRSGAEARHLSHGERRQLELAITLAANPRLLLLDEPTSGLSPAETEMFVSSVERLPAHTTVVLIEHDMDVVFRLAEHVTVLDLGKVIASGPPRDVAALPAVRRAYLGGE
jgi:branched-chain amino acid transport system ATP-binding protein